MKTFVHAKIQTKIKSYLPSPRPFEESSKLEGGIQSQGCYFWKWIQNILVTDKFWVGPVYKHFCFLRKQLQKMRLFTLHITKFGGLGILEP